MTSRYRNDLQRAWSRIAAIPTGRLETYSAGSASALELALRHPDRVVGLVLANARLGGPTPNKLLKPIQGTVYGWERLWWLYRRFLPSIPRADRAHADRQRRRRPLGRHQYAVTAAARIPDTRLVAIDRGGHLFLSHDAQVRAAIGGFINTVAQPERRRR